MTVTKYIPGPYRDTGVELILGSKVPCLFCFEIYTPEGRGGEKGGNVNFKTRHIEPLTQEITPLLYKLDDSLNQ